MAAYSSCKQETSPKMSVSVSSLCAYNMPNAACNTAHTRACMRMFINITNACGNAIISLVQFSEQQ